MRKNRINEYDFPGSSGVPSPLCRTAKDCEQLIDVLDEAAFYREMDDETISQVANVPRDKVALLMNKGKGSLADLMDILDALDVLAYSLPDQDSLSRGIDG